MKTAKYSIQQFNKDFPNDGACLEYLFRSRFGKAKCPSCKRVGAYHRQEGTAHYVCNCGGHQISPKAGTIFEKSDTDLYKWFFAMWNMATAKNGVSAKELERQLSVTYKTAWRIAYQIRKLMEQEGGMFGGTVEADETYIGGKRHGTRGRGAKGKTAVFGMTERKGRVYAKAVPNVQYKTVMPLIRANVKIGTEMMTDELGTYVHLQRDGYRHASIRHSAKEYVRGKVHTNTIEGFWGQLKRSIDGTHHNVSAKHLQRYVDQHVWLWNGRASASPLFSELVKEASA